MCAFSTVVRRCDGKMGQNRDQMANAGWFDLYSMCVLFAMIRWVQNLSALFQAFACVRVHQHACFTVFSAFKK